MRNHGGGFIELDSYWDIGEEPRGREGMDAREAARRYNDHRHPALSITEPNDFIRWRDAIYEVSRFDTRLDVIGGTFTTDAQGEPVLQDQNTPLRRPGDLAVYQGVVWMWVSPGVVVPVGGQGNVNANGNFTRDISYSSMQVVSAREVPADITDAPVGGFAPLGSLIGSTLLRMPRFLSARSRPYAHFTITVTLWPTSVNAVDNALRESFPCSAGVLFRVLGELEDIPVGGAVELTGFADQLPVYAGDVVDEQVGADLRITQTSTDAITILETSPLALNMSKLYAVNIYARSHEYTQGEVDTFNAINGTDHALDDVRRATRCVCLVNSVTFDVESLLGVSPYVNDDGIAYTASTRT